MAPRQAAHRHDHVDRGEHEDLAAEAQQVQQGARGVGQRPLQPQELHLALAHRLQAAGDQRHQHQPQAQAQDVGIGDQQRHPPGPPPQRHAVVEDDRHRAFEHGEGQRAEEHHARQQHGAQHMTMRHEVLQLADDGARLPRHQPFEIAAQRLQQRVLRQRMRQHDHAQDEQRHDRQQRVVGHRAGQQHALVGAKRAQHALHEGPRVLQYLRGTRLLKSHGRIVRSCTGLEAQRCGATLVRYHDRGSA